MESVNAESVNVESVNWDDPTAAAVRNAMAAELHLRYADRLATRPPSAGRAVVTETVAYTGVAYTADRLPVGHAALRWLGDDLELKGMYVAPSHRGRGVSTRLLAAVEQAAWDLGAGRIVLQTGDRQPDAERLYARAGYTRIPIFPPYEALTYSRCFQKLLTGEDVRAS
ncbi:GNAT family N-acetyltransferase [Protofrankia sp. BMG5.30]|uniref:Acetyltransferase n=1 Tax=Protofrankia coriariae TaxID=1562887 RepID=A0ABR5F770_9ACTN|nr:acetyltransferase [Protofrankia coriariae]ONH35552.1 GNAT family N-acetyltransferase [Protofrankia sp. BMG5.30]